MKFSFLGINFPKLEYDPVSINRKQVCFEREF